jgi:hypothetical protein
MGGSASENEEHDCLHPGERSPVRSLGDCTAMDSVYHRDIAVEITKFINQHVKFESPNAESGRIGRTH